VADDVPSTYRSEANNQSPTVGSGYLGGEDAGPVPLNIEPHLGTVAVKRTYSIIFFKLYSCRPPGKIHPKGFRRCSILLYERFLLLRFDTN
jgi:hypothetical protein